MLSHARPNRMGRGGEDNLSVGGGRRIKRES